MPDKDSAVTGAGGPVVETTVEYGLVERATGKRIGLSRHSNDGEDSCNGERVGFERPEYGYPDYVAATPEAVAQALVEDTAWYNSSEDYPCWGAYKPSDLAMVRVDIVRTVTPVPLPRRDVPLVPSDMAMDVRRRDIAEVDADLAGLLPNGSYRFQLARPSVDAPDLADLAGGLVDVDKYGTMRFRVVAVLPVPDDLKGRVRGDGEPALLVCLQDGRPSPIEPYCTLPVSVSGPAP